MRGGGVLGACHWGWKSINILIPSQTIAQVQQLIHANHDRGLLLYMANDMNLPGSPRSSTHTQGMPGEPEGRYGRRGSLCK